MYVYIFSTMVTMALANMAQCYKRIRGHKLAYKILFRVLAPIPLFLVAALRYNVGTDYLITYYNRFLLHLNGFKLDGIFEIGFIKLIDFIQYFTKEPQWIFIVCAFLFSSFSAKAIYDQSNDYALSFLTLVVGGSYFAYLNLMRNYVSLAIVLYAFKYVEQRKLYKYAFCVLLATTIHTSAILLLPLYFIYDLKINKWIAAGIVGSTGVLLPILGLLFQRILSYTKYYWYYNNRNSNVVPQKMYLILNIFILLIQMYAYKHMERDMKFQMHFKIQMIITVIALSSYVVPMVRRLILVPMFLQVIIIPYIAKYRIKKLIKYSVLVAIFILLAYITYRQIVILEMHSVLPYQTILSR